VQIYLALFKIIVGANLHDNYNYGQSGNLTANIDLATGALSKATSQSPDKIGFSIVPNDRPSDFRFLPASLGGGVQTSLPSSSIILAASYDRMGRSDHARWGHADGIRFGTNLINLWSPRRRSVSNSLLRSWLGSKYAKVLSQSRRRENFPAAEK
jgi:hypothetical protein